MARPKRNGLSYFPLDVDFFSDRKIKILFGKYGADGVTVYIYLLTEIYRENGYYLKKEKDFYFIASADLNMSSDKIEQIVEFLCERSMFEKQLFVSDDVLTARSIQRRFQEAVFERGKKTPIEVDGKIWLLEEKETKSYIKFSQKEGFSPKKRGFSPKNEGFSLEKRHKEKESKINKSKTNKIKEKKAYGEYSRVLLTNEEFSALGEKYSNRDELIKFLDEYIEMKGEYDVASHYAAIHKWVVMAVEEQKKRAEKLKTTSDKKGHLNNFKQDMPDFGAIEKVVLERQRNF